MKPTTQQLDRIADRWVSVCQKYGSLGNHPYKERQMVKAKLAVWMKREPLNLDVLERFPEVDFTHDIGGIIRDDEFMSARSAACYHPVE